MTVIEYQFEEISPPRVSGLILYGVADLRSNEDGDPSSFYVHSIKLDGGEWITRREAIGYGKNTFDAVIFRTIENELENPQSHSGREAQEAFSEQIQAETEAA